MSPRSHVPWFLLMGRDSQSTVWVWRLALPYSSRSSQRFLKPRLLKPACSGTHADTMHTQSGIHGQLTLSVPRLFLLRDSAAGQGSLSITNCQNCPNSYPLSRCHPTISSSVLPFSSCLQSFPASGSFPTSRLITSGGQSIGASASASVLSMKSQG